VEIAEAQVPFTSLAQVLGLAQAKLALESAGTQPAVLIDAGGQRVIFAVDEVVGQQEVVVHSLGKHVSKAPHLGGAAVLEDGRVVAVLNAFELVRLARPMTRGKQSDEGKTRVLIADDSLTTRSAMKALLEIAGYQVLPAGDGEEALKLLAETPVSLVVSDVQMPRMDGLALTRRIKADERFSALPVILVTSLDSATDRAAGLEAGADGYLIKREVERGKLLELVKQLLPNRG
jgi:two-component system chemotaxis sensor kinase CheA